jgi:hypothetical protein
MGSCGAMKAAGPEHAAHLVVAPPGSLAVQVNERHRRAAKAYNQEHTTAGSTLSCRCVHLGSRPEGASRPVLGDEATGVTEPMSAGAGDAEEISFGVGEVADDEAVR